MDTTTPFRPGDEIADDAELLQLAHFLAGGVRPRGRTLTVTWLDADDRLLGLALPIEDVPLRPDAASLVGLGTVLRSVVDDEAPGGCAVVVLERPGDSTVTADDRTWNRELREQADGQGVRLRGFFVAAGGQVRPLALDDA
ncbi:hypothetical protein ACH436_11850 [Isoptericola sp. NPDC019693]|uniref:hypothetical protein n=1 Tax=Isoptericola sp. NPDC019693 TaxID=3364009 RepID=UPI0037875BF4